MSLKLLKKHYGRHRFCISLNELNTNDLYREAQILIGRIYDSSHFQKVSNKFFIKLDHPDSHPQLMVEVIGLPDKADLNNLELWDVYSEFFYILEIEGDVFSVDFSQITSKAREIIEYFEKSGVSKDHHMMSTFQIVVDNEKIALQFFRQNDYSQKQLS